MTDNKPKLIDLFCGCGGFSLGFERAGFEVLLGIDIWADALKTFAFNHRGCKTLLADLSLIHPSDTQSMLEGETVDVIIGGPPCQGFSVAGKRIVDDIRNKLYKNFVNFVAHFKPKAFVMENVPNILTIGGGAIREAILDDFAALGYTTEYKIMTASDYGVPQNRRRAIFVGFRNGHHFEFPSPLESEKVTSSEAISDLPEHSLDDGHEYVAVFAEMPVKTVLRITYCEPGLKGDTATNATKPATVETAMGEITVRVPLFINEGELIEVDMYIKIYK